MAATQAIQATQASTESAPRSESVCETRIPKTGGNHRRYEVLDRALALVARLCNTDTAAVVERPPNARPIRWLRGIGNLDSRASLAEVLFLLPDPLRASPQKANGVALLPFGEHHALVVVASNRSLNGLRLQAAEVALHSLALSATLRSRSLARVA